MTSLSTFSVYFTSITEALQPYTPYIYYIAFCIGIIAALHIRYLLLKNRKAIIENISKDKISFSKILIYPAIKHSVPSIGVQIEIINSSAEMIYCSVNSEVTFLKINDRANKQKLISSNIKVPPYSHPKSFNCLKNQIQDIEVYKNLLN